MQIRDQIRQTLESITRDMGHHLDVNAIEILTPSEPKHGDYATNLAFRLSSGSNKDPKEIGQEIVERVQASLEDEKVPYIQKAELAANGFVNFFQSKEYLVNELSEILGEGENYGRNMVWGQQKIIVEYTDPNPFKEFHIGHLMSNAIGESIARMSEFMGAEVKRADYFSDVGMHVAKSIWGLKRKAKSENLKIEKIGNWELGERIKFMGEAYAFGATQFEENENAAVEIKALNKVIYERSDEAVNSLYDQGRAWSLEYLKTIFQRLGTDFDFYFPESEVGPIGLEVVQEGLEKGVFEESNGAVIFPGEKYGLHNRVFINSVGLPTYESKDLGLAKAKHKVYSYDRSVIVTGNEITDYFRVVLKALSMLYPELEKKTNHIPHGMLRLKTGKMSSRTGKVVTGVSLIDDVKVKVAGRMEIREGFSEEEVAEIVETVAIGAIKYSILRQSPGKDIIFDFDQSLSLEGNSGPYLQYTYARAKSVLRKLEDQLGEKKELGDFDLTSESEEISVIKKLVRFPEIIEDAAQNYSPNTVASYLFDLAREFNSFYNSNQILSGDEKQDFRVALTAAVAHVLKNGLRVLGIKTVERM